jgi:hypothetical protein
MPALSPVSEFIKVSNSLLLTSFYELCSHEPHICLGTHASGGTTRRVVRRVVPRET